MKKLIVVFFIMLVSPVWGADLYYTQSGGGSGASCASPSAISAISFSAGNTYHLCGTITTAIAVGSNGSSGSPITIKFETGAKMSSPVWSVYGAINISSRSYIVIDGGTNGIIENTANGTSLANHANTRGILADDASNIEIKNLTIQNLYVRTSSSDTYPDSDNNNGIYSLNPGGNWSIHNNIFEHAAYHIDFQNPYASTSNYSIYNNTFGNCNIAINWGLGGSYTTSTVNIYNNIFHDYDSWDNPGTNYYHHNGLHMYAMESSVADGWNFYNNKFYGETGEYTTSTLAYFEADSSNATIRNSKSYNNIALAPVGASGVFGAISYGGAGLYQNCLIANNTLIGTNSADYGIEVSGKSGSDVLIRNNIIMNFNIGTWAYSSTPGAVYSYNLFSGNTSNGITGTNAVITSSPGVNSDGTLSSGSPAINAGTSLVTYFTTDYLGATRSGTWDIGAYEYDSGGDTTAPTVTITSPTSSDTYPTSSSTITISGTATDDVGVTSVTWSNDRGGSGTCTGTTSWSQANITLYSGVNVITISATDGTNIGTDILTVTYTPVVDETPPTVTAVSVNGSTATITFDETVVTTGYDTGDFNLDCTSPTLTDVALSSPSGSGASRTFTIATPIVYGQVCNLDYVGSTNDIEDTTGNDMVAFSNMAVTNNTPQSGVTPEHSTSDVKGIVLRGVKR